MKSRFSRGTVGQASSNGIILLWSVLLLVSIVLALLTFVYAARQDANDEQYILRAEDQRVLVQRIAKNALVAVRGDKDGFDRLRDAREGFETLMWELKKGTKDQSLPPSPAEVQPLLNDLEKMWQKTRTSTDDILSNKQKILALRESVAVVSRQLPALRDISDKLVQTLVEKGASAKQIYTASRQMMLAQRISEAVNGLLDQGNNASDVVEGLRRDLDQFGKTLEGLLNGDKEKGIERVVGPTAISQLREAAEIYGGVNQQMQNMVAAMPSVMPALKAAAEVATDSDKVDDLAAKLVAAYRASPGRFSLLGLKAGPLLVSLFTALAVLFLILLVVQLLLDARRREQASKEQNEANQKAILRLLDEMGDLADGDLTVTATVTEDITGAIADSINYAIEALRSLVTTINETSAQVSSSAQESRATAMHLAEASEHQAEQIIDATGAIREMTTAIDQMSQDATESAEVAQHSTQIAGKGAETVRRTIEGMDGIREQIQETAKRIKRLGESSQEIGDIVELIDDIADQTNILALNAAMQAAMAGESGRGFAVVADEVQRLAERSSNATKQIEALVKTIQADTNEAVRSMEASTTGVVSGAKLAEDAGEALKEIENVSNYIAELTRKIADSAQRQSTEAGKISNTMSVIQEITTQTSEGTGQTAASIGKLAELATDLRRSVAGFRLPE